VKSSNISFRHEQEALPIPEIRGQAPTRPHLSKGATTGPRNGDTNTAGQPRNPRLPHGAASGASACTPERCGHAGKSFAEGAEGNSAPGRARHQVASACVSCADKRQQAPKPDSVDVWAQGRRQVEAKVLVSTHPARPPYQLKGWEAETPTPQITGTVPRQTKSCIRHQNQAAYFL
jgi:hypothetical protein